jgi:molybdopterin-containing oxidoreductase family membrane subunit
LHAFITQKHLENCAKLTLVTGLIVSYGYMLEWFLAWYSGNASEIYQAWVARPLGPGATMFWITIICNVIVPQLFWWKRARTSLWTLWIVSVLVGLGMWGERFMIIVQSLQRELLPSMWSTYAPTWVDLGIFVGTIGFFLFLFMLFLRFVPIIALAEMREMKHALARADRGAHA